jgi:glutamate dehydrogenase
MSYSTDDPDTQVSRWTTDWDSEFTRLAAERLGAGRAAELCGLWLGAFPLSYREDFSSSAALNDVLALETLAGAPGAGGPGPGSGPGAARHVAFQSDERRGPHPRLKIISLTELTLDDFVPPLRDLGLTVTEEKPYRLLHPDGAAAWIYGLGLQDAGPDLPDGQQLRIASALRAVWAGAAESDSFNRLVTAAGLAWPEAAVLRAYSRYLRQAGLTFSHDRVARVLAAHAQASRDLIGYYGARFDPDQEAAGRPQLIAAALNRLEKDLDGIRGNDDDQIIRSFLQVITSTVRTNSYQHAANGGPTSHLVFKIDPAGLPFVPDPRPDHEFWVYAPHMEAIYVRYGRVARGGLRWSDRREDFRAEVLDLLQAQAVRNAVIVPAGAGGAFISKGQAARAAPAEVLPHGQDAYRTFIHGLLDVTDNLVLNGRAVAVRAPGRVVRHDGDDAYLVVAADQGTTGFSDLANSIAAERGFWLGDAFAPDGSSGYDQRAMGITARGVWESVKRHLREMGFPYESGSIDAVAVGDMGGDVLGQAMLYSERIALLAAFDRRHIFIDPRPDTAATFAERARLSGLREWSWAEFDASLLSPGGNVYSRRADAVEISREAAEALGYDGPLRMAPDQLVQAVLRAPVTLLFHGGPGTYVKGSAESHLDAADKGNDPVRINADELRAKVIAEGGTQGVTAPGRIQAAMRGVRINTDAIDRSAGLDCSDHEVNIKILLNAAVAAGDLTGLKRASVLTQIAPDVADAVLGNSFEQNYALGTTVNHKPSVARVFARAITALEESGRIDPRTDALPGREELATRIRNGQSLTRPEIAVLMAHIKSSLRAALLASPLPEEPWAQLELEGYFPPPLVARTRAHLGTHPLRREIISTVLANRLVNHAGITFVHRLCEETGAGEPDAVRAYCVSAGIWGQQEFFDEIRALDGRVSTAVQDQLDRVMRRLLDRSSRWFLKNQVSTLSVRDEVDRFAGPAAKLSEALPSLLHPSQNDEVAETAGHFQEQGVPAGMARKASALLYQYPLLDIIATSGKTGLHPEELARTYFDLFEQIEGRKLLSRIDTLPRNDAWETMARASLREDFYDVLSSAARTLSLTASGTAGTSGHSPLVEGKLRLISEALQELSDADSATDRDFEILSVILRALRSLRTDAFHLR